MIDITNMVIMTVVTAVIVPFFAPMLMDTLACINIWLMNRAKGRPTWMVGTHFYSIVFPSGNVIYDVTIDKVSFRFITLKTKYGYLVIKKRTMLGLLCTTEHE